MEFDLKRLGMLRYLLRDNKLAALEQEVAAAHVSESELAAESDAESDVEAAPEHELPGVHDDADEVAVLRAEIEGLRRDVEELALFARTCATLLVERGVVDDATFLARMTEIDVSDGVEDGRLGAPPPPEARATGA